MLSERAASRRVAAVSIASRTAPVTAEVVKAAAIVAALVVQSHTLQVDMRGGRGGANGDIGRGEATHPNGAGVENCDIPGSAIGWSLGSIEMGGSGSGWRRRFLISGDPVAAAFENSM
jgi:hypothetical protein